MNYELRRSENYPYFTKDAKRSSRKNGGRRKGDLRFKRRKK
jgi:hypothetical protein